MVWSRELHLLSFSCLQTFLHKKSYRKNGAEREAEVCVMVCVMLLGVRGGRGAAGCFIQSAP